MISGLRFGGSAAYCAHTALNSRRPCGAKDRKRLRAIQQATGGGREAEVALEWLTRQHADLAPEHLAGLNWLSSLLLERRRKCAADLDGKVRAKFRRTAEKLEERLAIMRSEHNLLAEHPHTTFARSLANLTEAHATDLLGEPRADHELGARRISFTKRASPPSDCATSSSPYAPTPTKRSRSSNGASDCKTCSAT